MTPTSLASSEEDNRVKGPVSISTSKSSANDLPFVNVSVSSKCGPHPVDTENALAHSCIKESDYAAVINQNLNTKVDPTNRLTAGLLSLRLSSVGLVVCLREAEGAERYVKALAATGNEEIIKCRHSECNGTFNPDCYQHSTKGSNEELEDDENFKQAFAYKVGLERIIVAPSRMGGIRFYGRDGVLIHKISSVSRNAKFLR